MTIKTRAEAALLATTFIWGSTFVVQKIGLQHITPVALTAFRFLVSALLLALLFHRSIFPIPRPSLIRGSILGLFLYIGFITQTVGLNFTTASKSAFITGMMVIFVPFLQFIIERRAPKLGNIIGVGMVTVGLWLLTSPEGSAFNIGDALTLVCAIMFALYIVYLDVISKEMPVVRLSFIQIAATAAYALVSLALFEVPAATVNGELVFSLLFLTFLATALTTIVQTRFQKDTTPTRAVIIFSVEPVIASAIAYVVLAEELGLLGVAGGAVILAGVILSQLSDTIPFLNRSWEAAPGDGDPPQLS